jgi:hypothetical protein
LQRIERGREEVTAPFEAHDRLGFGEQVGVAVQLHPDGMHMAVGFVAVLEAEHALAPGFRHADEGIGLAGKAV